MQKIKTSATHLLILAATDYPENLDPIVRNSFEKKIEISLPEWEARIKILAGCLKGVENSLAED